MRVQPTTVKPMGYRQIIGLSAVKSLTDGVNLDSSASGIPSGADFCVIQAESQVVRWMDDGKNPSATKGMRIAAGGELLYDGDLTAIRFLEEVASAKLNVAFFQYL